MLLARCTDTFAGGFRGGLRIGPRRFRFGVALHAGCAQLFDPVDRGLMGLAIIVRGLCAFGDDFGKERFCCHGLDNAEAPFWFHS